MSAFMDEVARQFQAAVQLLQQATSEDDAFLVAAAKARLTELRELAERHASTAEPVAAV